MILDFPTLDAGYWLDVIGELNLMPRKELETDNVYRQRLWESWQSKMQEQESERNIWIKDNL